MTKDERRTVVATAAIRARHESTSQSLDRLEAAIDASDGVPIRELGPDDSLAVSIEEARADQEQIMKTERSRRVGRLAGRGF